MTRLPESLVGYWRITWMDLWDQEAVETMGPGLLRLGRDGLGEISFICVEGRLDCHVVERDGKIGVEFSWEGADEGDSRSGRGSAFESGSGNGLEGHIYFHLGDDSAFRAERTTVVVPMARPRRRRARRGGGTP
jgi:hypothetical protein